MHASRTYAHCQVVRGYAYQVRNHTRRVRNSEAYDAQEERDPDHSHAWIHGQTTKVFLHDQRATEDDDE